MIVSGSLLGCASSAPPDQAQCVDPGPPQKFAFDPGTPLMTPNQWAQVQALDGTGTPADLNYNYDPGYPNRYGYYSGGVWFGFRGGSSSCNSSSSSSAVTTCSSPPVCR